MRLFPFAALFFTAFAVLSLSADEKPASPLPPVLPEAAHPPGLALFNGKDLSGWKAVDAGGSGEVAVEDGALVIGHGETLSGVVFEKPETLPLTNYEVRLQARRERGNDFFCGITFPVGDLKTCATLVLGGWGGAVTGVSNIDGMDASENGTTDTFKFEDNKWYDIRLKVTPEKLEAWIGDKQIVNQEITGKKISLRRGSIELYAPFGLSTFQTRGALRDIRLLDLKKAP